MSADEFDLWRLFYERFPFDPESMHHLAPAQIASLYANAHRKSGTAPMRVTDFLLTRPKPAAGDIDDQLRSGSW